MASFAYQFVQGDTASKLEVTCKDQDGNAIDLSGCTVRCAWGSGARTMTITNAAGGIAEVTFSDEDDLVAGEMSVEIEIVDAAGGKKTSLTPLTFTVRPRLRVLSHAA